MPLSTQPKGRHKFGRLIAWLSLLLAGACLVGNRWSRWRGVTAILVLFGFALGGFAVAKLRTESVKAPVVQPGGRPAWVEAWVVDVVSPGVGGQRLLLAPIRIGNLSPGTTPMLMRVTLRPDMALPAPG